MTYKSRNSIVLAIQLCIILGIGAYLGLYYYPRQMIAVRLDITKADQIISTQPAMVTEQIELTESIAKLETRLETFNRRLDPMEGSTEILNRIGRTRVFGATKFSMVAQGDGKTNLYAFRKFKLTGEGNYGAVFALLWLMEGGPELISVDKVAFRGTETIDSLGNHIVIPFDMEIRTISSDIPLGKVTPDTVILSGIPLGINPFYPLIASIIPPNTRGLLEVDRAELRALLTDKAILADAQGKLHTLAVGDEVYLGQLAAIDPVNNRVEFRLNRGGIVERFVLKLSYGSKAESWSSE